MSLSHLSSRLSQASGVATSRGTEPLKPDEPSIQVLHLRSIEPSDLADLREALSTVSENVELRDYQPEPQANVDWALPATAAIFLAAPFVHSFLSTLGSKAAEGVVTAFASTYKRIKGRSKWVRAGGKIGEGPVMNILLSNALPEQQAAIVFTFPTQMSQTQVRTALSRLPAIVGRERRRGRRYFPKPGSVRGSVERSVRFYFMRSSGRWKRVWPTREWDERFG